MWIISQFRIVGAHFGAVFMEADHPSAICFLYLLYMQKVVLVPDARICLAERS